MSEENLMAEVDLAQQLEIIEAAEKAEPVDNAAKFPWLAN